ncbi:hypothetical protein [Aquamicrobium terrae]|uniref:DUF885 domain-containing protein n=1 Tax=Aquamicrobium terrae TaxID=1324945 RepID=A0ABV2MZN4_9HYPH
MELGRQLARLTAGIDGLYRAANRGAGFLNAEGLIPVAMAAGIAPQPLRDYDEAEEALIDFRSRLGDAETALRRDWLDEMSDSLLALVATFRGDPISFGERLERQIRVPLKAVPQPIIDGLHSEIRSALDELGFRGGSLAEDHARWAEGAVIPTDTVLAVIADYQAEARARCAARMFAFDDEWMMPVGCNAAPFSAYCDYPSRQMLLNLDFPYTAFSLKHLATHEAFPGHLVHMKLREIAVAEERMPLEAAQVVTSSASSALYEGIADNGLHFLDWIEGPEDRLGLALQKLRSALRCTAAWMHHGEGRPLDEIVPEIAAASLQDLTTTRSRLAFLAHDLRAPFVHAYWCGYTAVNEIWTSVETERRRDFWAFLYGHMHTPRTLARHWERA